MSFIRFYSKIKITLSILFCLAYIIIFSQIKKICIEFPMQTSRYLYRSIHAMTRGCHRFKKMPAILPIPYAAINVPIPIEPKLLK